MPLEVPGVFGAEAVAVGETQACAVSKGGEVTCWGGDLSPQLELSPGAQAAAPARSAWLRETRQVVLGSSHGCALDFQGDVSCWGRNEFGQLGDGSTEDRRTQVALPGDVSKLAAAYDRTCALTRQGEVWCWGQNSMGALGSISPERCSQRGTRTLYPCSAQPRRVHGLSDATDVALGNDFGCAVRKDGSVQCWGSGNGGVLGLPAPPECVEQLESLRPVDFMERTGLRQRAPCSRHARLAPGVSEAVEIVAARDQACVRRRDGQVMCWGANQSGAMGVPGDAECPSGSPCSRPHLVRGLTQVLGLSMAEGRTNAPAMCALRRSGDVLCWGGGLERERTEEPLLAPTPLHFAPRAPEPAPLRQESRGPTCLAQRGGCPSRPEPPQCTRQWRELTVEQALSQSATLENTWVAVRGALVLQDRHQCTLKGCGPGQCCNGCSGGLALGGGQDSEAVLPIEDLPCSGDESLLCCQFPVRRQQVVVRGRLVSHETLELSNGRLAPARRFRLNSTEVCTP